MNFLKKFLSSFTGLSKLRPYAIEKLNDGTAPHFNGVSATICFDSAPK